VDATTREFVEGLLGAAVANARSLTGGDISDTVLATLADGRPVVVKSVPGAGSAARAGMARAAADSPTLPAARARPDVRRLLWPTGRGGGRWARV